MNNKCHKDVCDEISSLIDEFIQKSSYNLFLLFFIFKYLCWHYAIFKMNTTQRRKKNNIQTESPFHLHLICVFIFSQPSYIA